MNAHIDGESHPIGHFPQQELRQMPMPVKVASSWNPRMYTFGYKTDFLSKSML